MSLETKVFYEFKNFRLDTAEKVLQRDGKPVSITPKAFHLLEILVKNHGHIVEKKRLLAEIWADSFVEDGNLTFNARMLRKILDDDARHPRFIETVPRRGYRFIHEVRETFTEINKNPPLYKVSPPRKSYFPIAAIIILLLGTIAVASWFVRRQTFRAESDAPILSAPFHSEKFLNSSKAKLAAISPDGKAVVYVEQTGSKYGVWLRRLETSETVQIIPPSAVFYFGLTFAHDGQTVYFVRRPQTETESADIYRVSIFGGVPEKIVEHAEGWTSLSPDDRQISFVRCNYRDDDFCALLTADADGRNERKLLTRPRPVRLTDNQFSPDGTSIAFAAGESFNGAPDFRLSKIDLASGAESEISPHGFFGIKSLKWLPDGGGLLAAASEKLDGKAKIWQISVAGGKAQPLTDNAENYSGISLDKDGRHLVAEQSGNNFQLYYSANGATEVLTAAREAVFAPGGKIIYAADDGDIWTINRDGGEQRQLTSNPAKDFVPYAAPDGKYIYFTSNRTGANQIWRMDADGTNQTQITKNEGGYPIFVSSDGNWIYYESGLHQSLWKVSADGGEEVQISERKIYNPAISPDGSLAAFFFRDLDNQRRIAVMQLADQKIVKTLDFVTANSIPVKIVWSADNRTINYVTGGSAKNSLWSQSLDENTPRPTADLGNRNIEYFDLSPDGAIIYTSGEWLHNIVSIDGFK